MTCPYGSPPHDRMCWFERDPRLDFSRLQWCFECEEGKEDAEE